MAACSIFTSILLVLCLKCISSNGQTTQWPPYTTPSGDTSECQLVQGGYRYLGVKTTTRSGYHCQRWDSNSPHRHHYKRNNLYPSGNISLAQDYCRNPDLNWNEGLWCYTNVTRRRWDHCDVPFCKCKQTENGVEFRGQISVTSSGLECQSWFSSSPHAHNYTNVRLFPDRTSTQVGNNCRNPNGSRSAPWCFTTDSGTIWEFCNVPLCNVAMTTSSTPVTTVTTSAPITSRVTTQGTTITTLRSPATTPAPTSTSTVVTTQSSQSASPSTSNNQSLSLSTSPSQSPSPSRTQTTLQQISSAEKASAKPTENPIAKERKDGGGVNPAAIYVPIILLVLGVATGAAILIYYYRWHPCLHKLKEDKPETEGSGHFDNPLYGQTGKPNVELKLPNVGSS